MIYFLWAMASMAMLVITRSGIYGFFSTINHRIQSLMFGNGGWRSRTGAPSCGTQSQHLLAFSRLFSPVFSLPQLYFSPDSTLLRSISCYFTLLTSLYFTLLYSASFILLYSPLLSSSLVYPILLYAALYCSTLSYYSTLHYSALLSFPLI